MRQEGRFKFCLDTKNNRALPLNPACLERSSVQSLADLPFTWEIFEEKSELSFENL
jgi:hypothetical protein